MCDKRKIGEGIGKGGCIETQRIQKMIVLSKVRNGIGLSFTSKSLQLDYNIIISAFSLFSNYALY